MVDRKVEYSKQKELEERLKKLPRQRYKVITAIVAGIVSPFLFPFIPKRSGSPSGRTYEDEVIFYFAIFAILIPVSIYFHLKKVNEDICEVKRQLRELKRKEQ
ncbi:hypothetical protein ACYSNM_09965 [Myroides sp. LJL116]